MSTAEASWLEVADGIPEARRIVERVFEMHIRKRRFRLFGFMVASLLIWSISTWSLHVFDGVIRGAGYAGQLIASGAVGILFGRAVRPRIDIHNIFRITTRSVPLWSALHPKYDKRSFKGLLEAHGPHSFEVRNIEYLERVLAGLSDSTIGMWRVDAIRNELLYRARLKRWVDAHSGGRAELGQRLSSGTRAGTLGELAQLLERIGKRARD